MRIAWTGPIGDKGGVPEVGLLILRDLLRMGVEVDLYTPGYSFEQVPIDPQPGLRIIQHRSKWEWGRWYSRTKAGALFSGLIMRTITYCALNLKLLREHRRRPYDAVYQLSQTELFLLGALPRFAPPIVVHPCTHHAGELRWHRAEQPYALESERRITHFVMRGLLKVRAAGQPRELAKADRVLGLSERFNELLHEDYGVPRNRLGVVRTPVDLTRFTPDGDEERQAKRVLLFISRISVRKGVEEIIQLSHRLDDLSDSVRIVVVGGATQWSDYTKHLSRLNPRVATWAGPRPSAELPSLMRGASMLVIPSAYEPGSIATAEALACGLPVVLSTEVGNAEAVDGPHGAFHEPGDVDGLEAAVRLMLDRIAADPVGVRASARANAQRAFAPSVVARALMRELSEGIGADRSATRPASPEAPTISDADYAASPT